MAEKEEQTDDYSIDTTQSDDGIHYLHDCLTYEMILDLLYINGQIDSVALVRYLSFATQAFLHLTDIHWQTYESERTTDSAQDTFLELMSLLS